MRNIWYVTSDKSWQGQGSGISSGSSKLQNKYDGELGLLGSLEIEKWTML